MNKQIVIFCDFDGTITEKDNIIDAMREFAPPVWKDIVQNMFDGKKTLRQGVGALFELIPAEKKGDLVRYIVQGAKVREGFQEFLAYCRQEHIRFLVTSNGIDFFIDPILEPYIEQIDKVYCNSSDDTAQNIHILWPHPCDEHCKVDCGMCKTTIIRSYDEEKYYKIVIGDSITDLEGAKNADWTIARSYLLDKCQELQLSHHSFETFYDCIKAVEEIKARITL